MPLTTRGRKIMRSMRKTYGSKKKAEEVFYASRNKGTIKKVERARTARKPRRGR